MHLGGNTRSSSCSPYCHKTFFGTKTYLVTRVYNIASLAKDTSLDDISSCMK